MMIWEWANLNENYIWLALIVGAYAFVLLGIIGHQLESRRFARELRKSSDEDLGHKGGGLAHTAGEHEPTAGQDSRRSVSESKVGSGWRYVASRAIGAGHVKQDIACQDFYSCEINDSGWLIVAVADGAGSAAFSDIGARLAAETAVSSLSESGAKVREDLAPALREACQRSRDRVFREASSMEVEPRQLACTLLLFFGGPGGSGVAHIGDGVLVSRHAGMDWDCRFWPDHGEYVNTTRFLTDDDALDVVRVSSSSETPFEVAVMTDGLEYLALDFKSKSAFGPFFEGVMAPVKAAHTPEEQQQVAAELGKWLGSKTLSDRSEDDLTLVLAIADGEA